MNKVFVQSRSQYLFNWFYTSTLQIVTCLISAVVISMLTDSPLNNLSLSLSTIIVLSVVYIIWIMIFNSGKSEIILHGLELDENGVTYIHSGSKETISWANFKGLIIKNRFPRLVILRSSNNKNIEFNYYVFSSKQRMAIFNYLSSK